MSTTMAGVPADVHEAAIATPQPVATAEGVRIVDDRETNRWYGLGAIVTVLLGIGALFSNPGLVLVSALGIGYAAFAKLQPPPNPDLSITRTVGSVTPESGDEIEVTLAIENVGPSTVFDLRIIDGVPEAVTVVDGSPRRATALRPGQRATITYTVEVVSGHHAFDPVTLIVRDVAGAHERVLEAEVPSRIHAEPLDDPLPAMALRPLTGGMTGRIVTDDGGSGVEFHAVREYRPGDPLNRIDWNRRARSGELATVDFRREQMATVVLVIDARPAAYVGHPDADRPSSERCTDAAARLFFALLDAGDRVGVTTLGERDCWLPPNIGADHREHGRLLFAAHPSLGPKPPTGAVSVITEEWELDHRIPDSTQLVFISPMADGGAARYATRFEARGHPVTVLSPNPCATDTLGHTVAAMERQLRIRRLRDRGTRVIDWDPSERSLAAMLEVAATRWSA